MQYSILTIAAGALVGAFGSTQHLNPDRKPAPTRGSEPARLVFGDYDSDGLSDVVAVAPGGELRLFRNLGDGAFDDVSPFSGLGDVRGASFLLWQDYDRDRRSDLFVGTSCGPRHLFRNLGDGSFEDVTETSGLVGEGCDLAAQWLDYDGDGRLDLHLDGASGGRLYHALPDGRFEALVLLMPAGMVDRSPEILVANASEEQGPANVKDASPRSDDAASERRVDSRVTAGSPLFHRVPISTSLIGTPTTGGTQSLQVFPACATSIKDQANPGVCLQATSVPTPGMLFPPPHDGGVNNDASGTNSFIGGGYGNTAGDYAMIGGGAVNTAAFATTIGGGWYHTASGWWATVGGGRSNVSSGYHATVGGGYNNTASGSYATVGGGGDFYGYGTGGNTASGSHATVSGGVGNTAYGTRATVGGGGAIFISNPKGGGGSWLGRNYASGVGATVCGGGDNTASGDDSTVGGGGGSVSLAPFSGSFFGNTAAGVAATVPGGRLNFALGDYSFAAGRRAKANHTGTFVWGDGQDIDKTSSAADEFNVYAEGGARFFAAGTSSPSLVIDSVGNVGIGTSSPSEELTVSGDICATGAIGACSDARFKTAVEPVTDALALVRELRAVRFDWDRDRFPERHFSNQRQLGFLAQELAEVVPEVVSQGSDGYYSVDYGKLTPLLVRALQEQETKLAAKDTELAELRERVARLEALGTKLAGLEATLRTLAEAR